MIDRNLARIINDPQNLHEMLLQLGYEAHWANPHRAIEAQDMLWLVGNGTVGRMGVIDFLKDDRNIGKDEDAEELLKTAWTDLTGRHI